MTHALRWGAQVTATRLRHDGSDEPALQIVHGYRVVQWHGVHVYGVGDHAVGTSPASAASASVTPMAPMVGFTGKAATRVLNTRTGIGAAKAKLGAGRTLTLKVLGLPAGATAVAINVKTVEIRVNALGWRPAPPRCVGAFPLGIRHDRPPPRQGDRYDSRPPPRVRAARTPVQEGEPSTTQAAPPPQRVGDPRALLAARLLAPAALIVTAFIHGKLAMQFGVGGCKDCGDTRSRSPPPWQ